VRSVSTDQRPTASSRLKGLHQQGALDVPLPGSGHTLLRFDALADLSALDLSLGRLAEGHMDAVAILAEAGRRANPSACYGVWAAHSADAEVTAKLHQGRWVLRGRKQFCSGATALTRALVTAAAPDGPRLFDVPLDRPGIRPVPGSWPAVGMAESDSLDVTFDTEVPAGSEVGPPAFYTDRPGFWFGAVGVAACWFGGAVGVLRGVHAALRSRAQLDEHQLAHLGAAAAATTSMQRTLAWAASVIDGDPADAAGRMQACALEVRHLVESGCTEVLQHLGRAGGARALCLDAEQSRRYADLGAYLSQHHGELDASRLGRIVLETDQWV
jgi:alkylation response protein AidB-like acyl-CoA dehydrogenase